MDDLGGHLCELEIRRLLEDTYSDGEAQAKADHLLTCLACRSRVRDRAPESFQPKGRLKEVFRLSEAEANRLVGELMARAEWEHVRRLPKTTQRDHLVLSRACHTREFLGLLLSIVKSPQSRAEAETAARLAILSVKGVDRWSDPEVATFSAQIWMELANSRRLAAEWDASEDALGRASEKIGEERLLRARWLSISASLQSDKGKRSQALETLDACRTLYEEENDWFSVGRSLIQAGHVLVDHHPENGLKVLDRARPIVEPHDPILMWLLEVTRTECLIETGQHFQALSAYKAAEKYKRFQPKPRAEIRSKFTAGRLLEALGHRTEAERLFKEVVDADLEHSLLKDSFMDLLYLFTFHLKLGESKRAAELGRRALSQLELLDSVHDQLKDVWSQLIDAADRRALDLKIIQSVREYIRVWWRRPGPGFTLVEEYGARKVKS